MSENEQLIITKYDLLFESRLTRVESAIENFDKHMTVFDKRMDEFSNRIGSIEQKMGTQFLWIIGLMMTLFGGFLLTMAVTKFM